jgi:hypothetical protein
MLPSSSYPGSLWQGVLAVLPAGATQVERPFDSPRVGRMLKTTGCVACRAHFNEPAVAPWVRADALGGTPDDPEKLIVVLDVDDLDGGLGRLQGDDGRGRVVFELVLNGEHELLRHGWKGWLAW